jgi:hypothetical protein
MHLTALRETIDANKPLTFMFDKKREVVKVLPV